MGNNNWMQILFIVLVFGGGAIQWVWRKLGEQRAIRQAKAEVERSQTERLRTGRTTAAPQAQAKTASVDLESIAARRQRQLEELRRRQQAAKRPTGAAPPRPQPRPTQASPSQARPQSRPGIQAPKVPVQRPHPGQQQAEAVRTKAKSSIDVSDIDGLPEKQFKELATTLERHQGEHELSEFAERFHKERREDTAEAGRVASARALAFKSDVPLTRAEWRRAIIASEILAKPVSLRPPE